ncbi:MAG: class I SAM-dependent methyltransferase [Bacteroidetes bacterium]|nr:class I SAM-dependent methyltransferase [Bacteroidota bacterium]
MKIPNPAFNYDTHGQKYSGQRKTDPRIAAYVHNALADSETVINIGAGSGSYEPEDKYVIAVEPSITMRTQRIANGKIPAINAKADSLPFDDRSFDAAMAMVTVHHWPDIEKGISEIRRVTKKRFVIMTFDPDALDDFWNVNYFPQLIEIERARYPSITRLQKALSAKTEVIKIPIPLDCVDGFQETYYGRPEAFLEKEVRMAQSAWGFLPADLEEKYLQNLSNDLQSGAWDKKFGHFRTQPNFTGALRLIVANL